MSSEINKPELEDLKRGLLENDFGWMRSNSNVSDQQMLDYILTVLNIETKSDFHPDHVYRDGRCVDCGKESESTSSDDGDIRSGKKDAIDFALDAYTIRPNDPEDGPSAGHYGNKYRDRMKAAVVAYQMAGGYEVVLRRDAPSSFEPATNDEVKHALDEYRDAEEYNTDETNMRAALDAVLYARSVKTESTLGDYKQGRGALGPSDELPEETIRRNRGGSESSLSLVEVLRSFTQSAVLNTPSYGVAMAQAADEIERLTKENEALTRALGGMTGNFINGQH